MKQFLLVTGLILLVAALLYAAGPQRTPVQRIGDLEVQVTLLEKRILALEGEAPKLAVEPDGAKEDRLTGDDLNAWKLARSEFLRYRGVPRATPPGTYWAKHQRNMSPEPLRKWMRKTPEGDYIFAFERYLISRSDPSTLVFAGTYVVSVTRFDAEFRIENVEWRPAR